MMNWALLPVPGMITEVLDILTRHLLGGENGVDYSDLELFNILFARLLQHGHGRRVVFVDDLALQFERVGQHESRQRVEAGREMLVLGFEGALCRTDILDAIDNLGFLRLRFFVEPDRS
ncbi:MAG: hypothetical protein ACLUNS_08910 [Alistipes shahii]